MSRWDFDVVVIGAGVVGLAVGRACALARLRAVVIERAAHIGTEISSRSSEVIHAGLYYPSASLKARLCVAGRTMLYDYCRERGIGHQRCGKIVVATREEQHARLAQIMRQAQANGVNDCTWLETAQVRALEPEVHCTAALLSPSTGIIDSHGLMHSLAGDIERAEGQIALRTEFRAARARMGAVEVETLGGDTACTLSARWLVNCAGLGAVAAAERMSDLQASTVPRAYFAKGQYFAISGRPFRRLIYPLPIAGGLGIHATLDLAGRVRFGPNVQWIEPIDWGFDASCAESFYRAIREYWPALPAGALHPDYVGIRPKIVGPGMPDADFRISTPQEHGVQGIINLFGIESPGLTSALALGEEVARVITSD
ncbi:MAG TPA: NAD(P)/FAD-dependent oxidoreductase [Steroidobacteraceae bacterium]|nr:NAD(P)/FAD-dependent oxidoreductase [Steroidobacteraceae bacterium]